MRRSLLPASLIAAVLVLGGCAPEPTEPPDPSASQTASPSSSALALTAGQEIDAATADNLNSVPNSQFKGYAMPDGSYVVVDRAAPLPEPVQQDVNARGEAVTQQFPRVEDSTSAGAANARSALTSEIGRQTGKQVILVTRTNGFDYDGNAVTTYWTTGAYRTPQTNAPRSRDEVIALIDGFLANNDASNYVVAWAN